MNKVEQEKLATIIALCINGTVNRIYTSSEQTKQMLLDKGVSQNKIFFVSREPEKKVKKYVKTTAFTLRATKSSNGKKVSHGAILTKKANKKYDTFIILNDNIEAKEASDMGLPLWNPVKSSSSKTKQQPRRNKESTNWDTAIPMSKQQVAHVS